MADTNIQPHQQPPPEPVRAIASDKIHVMVRNRRQLLFDEDVKAITSKNDTGIFDILPEHSNFISVLKESITLHKMDGTEQVIPLQNGVIKVKDSGIKCYIDLLTSEGNKDQNVVATNK
jgi:F0F1-type ATP synthase epsilon subunit